jgi:hypothetical protein
LTSDAIPGRESGQALVLVVVALGLFMFAALGLGIDGAQLYAHRQMAQAAADAAAQAAMMSILRGTNSTSTHPFSTSASFTCAVLPAALDLRTPCVYAQYNGFGTSADTVIVSFPTTVSGVTLSSGATPAVAVSVQRTLTAGLIRFAGVSTYTVIAKATAGILAAGGPCIVSLSQSGTGFSDTGAGNLTLTGCGIYDSSSLNWSAAGNITAQAIQYIGTYTSSGAGTVSPTPTSTTTPASDPFANVPVPSVGACANPNAAAGLSYPLVISDAGNHTLSPGVYCGGIDIAGAGNITFTTGTYILNGTDSNGKSFDFTGAGNLSGTNVMFYITGQNGYTAGPISTSGAGNLTFSALSSGSYQGILFYQDRSVTYATANSFSGAGNITGTFYFSTTSLTYSGAGNAAFQALVANKITISGAGNFKTDPTGQYTGLNSTTVGLMQ